MKLRVPNRFRLWRYLTFLHAYPIAHRLGFGAQRRSFCPVFKTAKAHFLYQAHAGDADLLVTSIRSLIDGLDIDRNVITITVLSDPGSLIPEQRLEQVRQIAGSDRFRSFVMRFRHQQFFSYYNLYEAFYSFIDPAPILRRAAR